MYIYIINNRAFDSLMAAIYRFDMSFDNFCIAFDRKTDILDQAIKEVESTYVLRQLFYTLQFQEMPKINNAFVFTVMTHQESELFNAFCSNQYSQVIKL